MNIRSTPRDRETLEIADGPGPQLMYARDWRGPSRIPFAARTRIAMSFTYRIDPEAGVLYVTAEGHVSQEERLKTMAAWLSDPLFRPGLHTYCDFSASASTPTLAELRAIVEYIERNAKRIGRVKLAVLAPKMVTFGVARQFQAMSAGGSIEVRVFTESRAAWNWLQGKPEPEPLV